jgi:hypothetical protein
VVAMADDRRRIQAFINRPESPTTKRSHAFASRLGYTVLFTSVFLAGLFVAKKRRRPEWRLSSRWALSSVRAKRQPRRGIR